MIPEVNRYTHIFPDPLKATSEGLVAWGGDLDENRVMSAYFQGIFPWYNENDPILWWSPDPRLVLYPKNLKISKSLSKSIKKFEVRVDYDFDAVIRKCQSVRKKNGENTWILDEIISCYKSLHDKGLAKSFGVYLDDELVGGLYGIDLGHTFCGESMFSEVSDASKVALVTLCEYCEKNSYHFIDCQIPSNHLLSMGAEIMSRKDFIGTLKNLQYPQ